MISVGKRIPLSEGLLWDKTAGPRADHFLPQAHEVDSYIADLRASTEMEMDLKIFHMHRNSIPQERIGTRLGIIQRTVSKHLEKMPTLANVLNTDLTKSFTVPQVAEKHRWPIFDPPTSPEGKADGGQVRLILKSNQITTILTAYKVYFAIINGILMEVMELSKVTAKYQVTIPVNVRKELGIIPGTEVDIAKKGLKYILVVDPIETLRKKWRGRFRGKATTMEYMDEVRGNVN